MIDGLRALRRAVVIPALVVQLWATVAAAAPFAYVSDFGADTVTVIDTASATVVATVPVGPGPLGVAVNWAGTRAYVGNSNGTVSVIRTDTNSVAATVPAGDVNRGIAVNPAGTRVYVASAGLLFSTFPPATSTFPGVVTVIDATLDTVVATVAVGSRPLGVAVSPDGQRVYVAADDGIVTVIDATANAVSATITVEPNPVSILIDTSPSGQFTRYRSNGNVTAGIAVHPDGTRVYVTSPGRNRVLVIDTLTNTVVESIPTGMEPTGGASNAAGTRLYVTNRLDRTVSVFDTPPLSRRSRSCRPRIFPTASPSRRTARRPTWAAPAS
jgi:YVTN family beta-propeller protein